VAIRFTALSAPEAEHAINKSFGSYSFVIEGGSRSDESLIRFKRAVNDELLDRVLRALQDAGAVVRSVETERATLLNVLESYEGH